MSRATIHLMIFGLFFLGNSLFSQNLVTLKKGDTAPNFIEIDDDGNKINLESYRGKIVLLNFTATYCGPCYETYHPMDALQKKYKEELKIISIHMDQNKDLWERRINEKGINFNVSSIWDSDQKDELFEMYGANGFPYFVLINEDGVVKKKWFGNLERKLNKNTKKAIRKIKTSS